MKNIFLSFLILVLTANLQAQSIQYEVSFENAVHHEAGIPPYSSIWNLGSFRYGWAVPLPAGMLFTNLPKMSIIFRLRIAMERFCRSTGPTLPNGILRAITGKYGLVIPCMRTGAMAPMPRSMGPMPI